MYHLHSSAEVKKQANLQWLPLTNSSHGHSAIPRCLLVLLAHLSTLFCPSLVAQPYNLLIVFIFPPQGFNPSSSLSLEGSSPAPDTVPGTQ